MLRLFYRFLYWLGGTAGSSQGSDIVYGFCRKFRKPEDIPHDELKGEIERLAAAIREST